MMSLFEMLGAILIGPLKLLFEVIFSVAYSMINHPGPAIIVLSLTMNILVLPLYRRADAIQIEARDTENKLKDVVTHIKKTFSGDERMMILQTYYRQNNYHPLSVLSGSISLLLEIPFFMAAYQFLRGLEILSGVSFGPISDLGAPDGMLQIGALTINLLPFLMTLINVISSSLYLKGFPLKTKIQLYGMALFFLVFLYNSPAALVFYWTLNNTFSLAKTLFYRLKNSDVVLKILLGVCGVGFVALGSVMNGFVRSAFMIGIGVVAQIPWILPLLKKKFFAGKVQTHPVDVNVKNFVLGAMFLSVLVGTLIPSTYVAASPQEYISVGYFYNPVWYVVYSSCISIGTFLVWLGVFYWLAKPAGKAIFSRIVWILSGVLLVNYMFFGTELGVLSPDLHYLDGFVFSRKEQMINIVVILFLMFALYFFSQKFSQKFVSVLLVGTIAISSMSLINIAKIAKAAAETKEEIRMISGEMPSFSMSENGKNVVVIMLDRGIGPFVPYLMEENPTLVEQFDGFTYYSNTLSYGGHTNLGAPALYGGYEYTPINMNLREDELLVDKHNEALKVMPALFAQEGYDATVIDPPYAGYQWIPDLSIYDDLPNVNAYWASGKFNDTEEILATVSARKRNFFLFSLMKTMPVSLQPSLYAGGTYRAAGGETEKQDTSGVLASFMAEYNVMKNLSTMTDISTGMKGSFVFLRSCITHEAAILQEPLFEPSSNVDNSAYYGAVKTITAGEDSYVLEGDFTISHYHANMAALIQLGNWFDYLRENNVYDNTRIIVVSDHGYELGLFHADFSAYRDMGNFLPMLMVKDFNAKGFTVSDEFMTNADVPTLAVDGVIQNPINPFTGNEISSAYKTENETQYVSLSWDWEVDKNNGNQFSASAWASVSEDVHSKENWEYYLTNSVFPSGWGK